MSDLPEITDATRVATARLLVAVRDRDLATVQEILGSGCDLGALCTWLCELHIASQWVAAPNDPSRLDRMLGWELDWAGVAS